MVSHCLVLYCLAVVSLVHTLSVSLLCHFLTNKRVHNIQAPSCIINQVQSLVFYFPSLVLTLTRPYTLTARKLIFSLMPLYHCHGNWMFCWQPVRWQDISLRGHSADKTLHWQNLTQWMHGWLVDDTTNFSWPVFRFSGAILSGLAIIMECTELYQILGGHIAYYRRSTNFRFHIRCFFSNSESTHTIRSNGSFFYTTACTY